MSARIKKNRTKKNRRNRKCTATRRERQNSTTYETFEPRRLLASLTGEGTESIIVGVDDNGTSETMLLNSRDTEGIPDFDPLPLNAPSTGTIGGSISVGTTVQNLWSNPSGNYQVAFYLSENTNITTSDTLLGLFTRGGISGNSSDSWTQTLNIPSSVSSGQYYVGIWVDPNNFIQEGNESNNKDYDPGRINLSSAMPDFDPKPLNAPSSGTIGGSINVGTVVDNLWSNPSGNYQSYFYLSTDTNITTSDTFLGSTTRSGISGNSSDSWTQTLNIPSSVSSGQYYVGIWVDPNNQIDEGNENNNKDYDPVRISLSSPMPDFDPQPLNAPSTGTIGGSISVGTVVQNLWSNPSGNYQSSFYLSTDTNINSNDILLTTVTRGGISGNSSDSWTQTLNIPSSVSSGQYYVGIWVDPNNQIDEGNENNNKDYDPVRISLSSPMPDFDPQPLNAPSTGTIGGSISVGTVVQNLWSNPSGNYQSSFYLSTDTNINSNDILLTTVTRGGISGNSSDSWTQTLNIPSSVSSGQYYVGIWVDPNNQIDEGNENNNKDYDPVRISLSSPMPDFDPQPLNAPASAHQGDSISIGTVVENIWSNPSPSYQSSFYLSTDTNIDSNDILLTTVTRGGIAGNAQDSWNQQITIPSNLASGNYYVGIFVDPANQIDEGNESNNQDFDFEPISIGATATGFNYSFGPPDGQPRCPGVNQCADGWQNVNDFANPVNGLLHLGEDWNFGFGADDLGQPIYAMADGVVTYAQSGGASWGGVVLVQSFGNFNLPGGGTDNDVTSMYAHLDANQILVSNNEEVSRGQLLGYIGPTPNGSTGPHLHAEIRTDTSIVLGPGYSNVTTGWVDVSDFIDLNRPSTGDVTSPVFSNAQLSGNNPNSPFNVGLGQVLNFSGTLTDETQLERITILVDGPRGQHQVDTFEVSGMSQSLNGYSFDTGNLEYAGLAGSYFVAMWGKDTSGNTDSRVWEFEVNPTSNGDRPVGIDISNNQQNIDWPTVFAQGNIDFAFMRASLGDGDWSPIGLGNLNNRPDSQSIGYANTANQGGILTGVYHVARPLDSSDQNELIGDAQGEADYFFSVAGTQMENGWLPPVVDIETIGGETWFLSQTETSLWIDAFSDRIEDLSGRRPVVYANQSFASNFLDDSVSDQPLWIARYNGADPQNGSPGSVSPWADWNFWQHTNTGSVPGFPGNVDLNVFNGNHEELVAWANNTGVLAPDLAVNEFSVSDPNLQWGGTVGGSIEVSNFAQGDASAFDVQLIISSNDTVGDADDLVIDSWTVGGLPAGQVWNQSYDSQLPGSAPSGFGDNFFIAIHVDPANSVDTEVNEFNNIEVQSVTVAVAEATVTGNAIEIMSGDTSPSGNDGTNFGQANLDGAEIIQEFVIRNDGAGILILGSVDVPVGFSRLQDLPPQLGPGEVASFVIQLNTETAGSKTGEVSFETNDENENPYTFVITGTVVDSPGSPDVEVLGNGFIIKSGDSTPDVNDGTDLGMAPLDGSPLTSTFTVQNDGDAELTLGIPDLPPGYSIVEALDSSIPAGQSDDFTIELDTSSTGIKSGEIIFDNNDPDDNESPYVFAVTGEVVAAAPEITVLGNGFVIESGDGSPSNQDGTNFGQGELNGSPVVRSFEVRNDGQSELIVGPVDVPVGFSLVQDLNTNILPGESATFTISMDSSALGTKLGDIAFNTNDTSDNENPFVFSISGEVVEASEGVVIGETSNWNGDSNWKTAVKIHTYVDPVVILGPASFDATDPAAFRVRNVTSNSFEFRLQEWDYSDGTHVTESAHSIVLESGEHVLGDGTVMVAYNATVNHNVQRIEFGRTFDSVPVVLPQVITENGSSMVTPRVFNVTTTGFDIFLQEEENGNGVHSFETVSWLAVETGAGQANGGKIFEVGLTGPTVTHQNSTINFENDYGSTPTFLAAPQSFNGLDPFVIRRTQIDGDSVNLFLQEEMSFDSEISHSGEAVGYFALLPGPATLTKPIDQTIELGETGVVDLTDAWSTISLNRTYSDPVIIFGPASTNGADPVTIRLRNVAADSFEVRIQEWDYLNGTHGAESVGYLVVEAGRYQLADGTIFDAGTAQTDHNWSSFSFEQSFDSTPIVFSQVTTLNGASAVTTRHQNVVANGFDLRLQEEQNGNQIHAVESVSWFAIEPTTTGSGNSGFRAGLVPGGLTDQPKLVEFGFTFGQPPVLLASPQTFAGADPVNIRQNSISSSNAVIFLDEESSLDPETIHGTEQVGFLAFESGAIVGTEVESATQLGESGQINDLTDTWRTINLSQTYSDPVVVFGPASVNGADPLSIRVRNVTGDSFEVRLEEWDYLNGTHGAESVGFVVMESGRHILADGTMIVAGNQNVDHNWANISLGNDFTSTPVVLTQTTSTAGASAVTTRLQNVSASGFEVKLQEEQAGNQIHAIENVGWIAIAQASGSAQGSLYEAVLTPNAVTHNNYAINFGQSFSTTPVFVAAAQTYNGSDPFTVRYTSLSSSTASVLLDEETSGDAETIHGNEVLGYLAFDLGGIFGSSLSGRVFHGGDGDGSFVNGNKVWPFGSTTPISNSNETMNVEPNDEVQTTKLNLAGAPLVGNEPVQQLDRWFAESSRSKTTDIEADLFGWDLDL